MDYRGGPLLAWARLPCADQMSADGHIARDPARGLRSTRFQRSLPRPFERNRSSWSSRRAQCDDQVRALWFVAPPLLSDFRGGPDGPRSRALTTHVNVLSVARGDLQDCMHLE